MMGGDPGSAVMSQLIVHPAQQVPTTGSEPGAGQSLSHVRHAQPSTPGPISVPDADAVVGPMRSRLTPAEFVELETLRRVVAQWWGTGH